MQVSGEGSGGQRGRRRNRRRNANPPPEPVVPVARPRASARPRRRGPRAGGSAVGLDAVVRFSRRELVMSITDSKPVTIGLHKNKLPGFAKLAGIYERVQWHSCKFWWVPMVGTTQSGAVTYGVDWDGSTSYETTRQQIALLTPSASHAVWCDTSNEPLILPASRLSSRPWYITQVGYTPGDMDVAPAFLVVKSDFASGGGEIWVEYSVTFSGIMP